MPVSVLHSRPSAKKITPTRSSCHRSVGTSLLPLIGSVEKKRGCCGAAHGRWARQISLAGLSAGRDVCARTGDGRTSMITVDRLTGKNPHSRRLSLHYVVWA